MYIYPAQAIPSTPKLVDLQNVIPIFLLQNYRVHILAETKCYDTITQNNAWNQFLNIPSNYP